MTITKTTKETYGNVVSGPMGLEMPESIAAAVDSASKTLPKDFQYRRVAKSPEEFNFQPGERADVSLITTDDPDRDDDVILPEGGDWSQYNRVVPFSHDYKSLPVGTCAWMKHKSTVSGNGVIAKTIYFAKPEGWTEAWMPDAIVHMQRHTPPGLTAKSIGLLPLEYRDPTPQELTVRPEWKNKRIIPKWKGFEYSCCSIPANPSAEMLAVAKSIGDPKSLAWLESLLAIKKDDGVITDAGMGLPACPKCKSDENVVVYTMEDVKIIAAVKDHKGDPGEGIYLCMNCMTRFTPNPIDPEVESDDMKAYRERKNQELLQAAIAAPYITVDTYRQMQQEKQSRAAREAADKARKLAKAAIWMASGKV